MIKILFGKTKRKILALFFLNSEKQYYFSEVVRAAGIGQGAVQRELKANMIYSELRSIMFKTYAIGEVLAGALKPFKSKIKVAFIYGSIAKGDDTARSDIDLFIIGQIDFGDMSVSLSKPEKALGRPINLYTVTPKEFKSKLKEKNHFVSSVIQTPKIMLIGSEDDIRRLG
jgi:predicted nucleotidyltransferase